MILTSRSQEEIRRQIEDLGQSFSQLREEVQAEGDDGQRLTALLNAVGQIMPPHSAAAGGEEVQL